ncbi:MAG: hypothetical protein ACOC8H_01740 [bacterium]
MDPLQWGHRTLTFAQRQQLCDQFKSTTATQPFLQALRQQLHHSDGSVVRRAVETLRSVDPTGRLARAAVLDLVRDSRPTHQNLARHLAAEVPPVALCGGHNTVIQEHPLDAVLELAIWAPERSVRVAALDHLRRTAARDAAPCLLLLIGAQDEQLVLTTLETLRSLNQQLAIKAG